MKQWEQAPVAYVREQTLRRNHDHSQSRFKSLLDKGLQHWRNADIRPSLASIEEASRVNRSISCGESPSTADILLVLQLTWLREWRKVEDVLSKQTGRADCIVHGDPITSILRANIRLAEGRYHEAFDLASEGLARVDPTEHELITSVGHLVMATTSLRLCDLRSALHYARMLYEDSLFGRLTFIGAEASWVVAQVTEAERGSETGTRLMSEVARNALHSHELFIGQPSAAPSLVRSALADGDREMAERVVHTVQVVAAKNREFRTPRISAMHAASLLDGEVDGLLQASSEHADPWTRAWATEDAGVVLAAKERSRSKGVTLLENALHAYASLGADHDVARVKSKLRGSSDNWRHTPSSRMPATTHHGLTATEARIADLVSQGLTNAQVANQLYLSRHTVAYHLKSIFKKLKVSSRGQLTSLWVQLRLVGPSAERFGKDAERPLKASGSR